jgi:threonylcarbamoyladenosine tRNA methylthiotransferase MtaB
MTSRPIDDIVREVEALAKNGYKEVVITGVHLGAYGKDINNSVTIADVLERIHPISGVERIRLSSIEPMDVPDDLIERMAQLPKLAPHFHLPLQSGNNEILKRMGRRYTVEEYARLVEKLRATFPDVGITTDIMVGFPGETDAQFNDTYDFINEMAFSRLHVFRYSPRKGTPAARYPYRIPPEISIARSEAVRELGYRLAEEFRVKMLRKVMEVLVEDSREGKANLLAGFTGNYIRVLIDVPDTMINRMIQVRLIELEDEFVKAELSGVTEPKLQ